MGLGAGEADRTGQKPMSGSGDDHSAETQMTREVIRPGSSPELAPGGNQDRRVPEAMRCSPGKSERLLRLAALRREGHRSIAEAGSGPQRDPWPWLRSQREKRKVCLGPTWDGLVMGVSILSFTQRR